MAIPPLHVARARVHAAKATRDHTQLQSAMQEVDGWLELAEEPGAKTDPALLKALLELRDELKGYLATRPR